MFLLTRPNESQIASFIELARQMGFSYSDTGASESSPPSGYTVDHNRISIGNGDGDWEKAKEAIKHWKMFELGWVELHPLGAPIEAGQTVAILIRHFGFYSLNAARIVYTIDEQHRYAFAYGTLTDHGESGEERFLVGKDKKTGNVFYDLFAFSRPHLLMAKIGYPLTRKLQKQFAEDSKLAMLRAINTIS